MIRTFVTEELKRTFVPGVVAGIAVALLSVATKPVLLRQIANPAETQHAMDVLVVFSLIAVASISGASAFSSTFRQGPLKLIENLPISRWRIWLVRFLISALTMVATGGLIVVAQPGLLDRGQGMTALVIAGGLLVFSGGVCVGLLVRGPTVGVALVAPGLLLPVFLFLLSISVLSANNASNNTSIGADILLLSTPISGINILLSFLMFTRGEVEVPRRRTWNSALVTIAIIGTTAVLPMVADWGLLTVGDDWTYSAWGKSPDGRYLALLLQKQPHAANSKVIVIDVDSGAVVKTFRQNGISDLIWEKDGSLLVFSGGTIREHILGMGLGTVHVTKLLPVEEQIFQRSSSDIAQVIDDPKRGPLMLLQSSFPLRQSKDSASVFRLGPTGESRELVSTPWNPRNSRPSIRQDQDEYVFRLFAGQQNRQWLIRDAATEITYFWGPLYFSDEVSGKAIKEIQRRPPGARGVFIYSRSDYRFDENSWLYFLEATPATHASRLLARRKSDTEWKEALSNLPLSPSDLKGLSSSTPDGVMRADVFGLWVGSRNGLVVRLQQSGTTRRIFIVDLVTGKTFDIEDANPPTTPGANISVLPADRVESATIVLSEVLKGPNAFLPVRYVYHPGEGTLTALPPLEPSSAGRRTNAAFRSLSGVEVHSNPGGSWTAVSPNGAPRTLWPQ